MSKRSDQPVDDPAMGSVDPALHPPRAFPDADWSWFTARCAALGIDGAEGRCAVLEALYGHLVGVNRWLNLTRLTAPRDYLKLHVLDSLVACGDTRLRHLAEGAPCVDLGSGGGYPGLPLALWHPAIPWVLVDSRKKKADFLGAACRLAQERGGVRRLEARHLRGAEAARAASGLRRTCQLVVCRAMGQAAEILAEAAPLLRQAGHLLIYKGPAFAGEEKGAALAVCAALGYRFIGERRVALEDGDPERVIVVFERLT
jgi:16S rRNA (guanine527-N7)-methyltransferase